MKAEPSATPTFLRKQSRCVNPILLSDTVLQHGALPRALPANHSYLRKIDGRLDSERRERILKLVDDGNELFYGWIPRHIQAFLLAQDELQSNRPQTRGFFCYQSIPKTDLLLLHHIE